jgi:hypothetical protein
VRTMVCPLRGGHDSSAMTVDQVLPTGPGE